VPVRGEIRVRHIDHHSFFLGNIGQTLRHQRSRLLGDGDHIFAFVLFAQDVGDEPHSARKSGINCRWLVLHRRVHLHRLLRRHIEQGNGDDRKARVLDLLDHVGRGVVRDEDHVWFQLEEFFDIDLGEATRRREAEQLRRKADIVGTQLFLPLVQNADNLVHRTKLHRDVERLVLQYDDSVHDIRHMHLAADLIGNDMIGPGGHGEQQATGGDCDFRNGNEAS
jgi:hypothetical protein